MLYRLQRIELREGGYHLQSGASSNHTTTRGGLDGFWRDLAGIDGIADIEHLYYIGKAHAGCGRTRVRQVLSQRAVVSGDTASNEGIP